MTLSRKLALGALVVVVALIACLLWVLGTESGTRFLLARAKPYLPAELALGETQGSLLGDFRIASVSWNSDSLDVAIRDASVEIELARLLSKHLAVRSLDVAEIEIEARATTESDANGELPSIKSPLDISIDSSSLRNISFRREQLQRSVDDIQFSGSLTGSRLAVALLSVSSSWLNARLEGDLEIADVYPGSLTVNWRWTESPSLQFAGDLRVRGDLRRYELEHTLGAPQQLATSGIVSYVAGELTFDLSNTWESFEWTFGESSLMSPKGSLRLAGDPGSMDISLAAQAKLGDLPETRIDLDGDLDLQSIRFSRLSASNDLGQLTASGSARWTPVPGFDVEYAVSNLDASLASDLLQGRIAAEGRANGTLQADSPEFAVLINKLSGLINKHQLNGGGEFTYAANRLSVSNGRVGIGANQISISGSAGDEIALDADLDLPAIQELLPDAGGSIDASIALRGSRERPEVRVDAGGHDVSWSGYSIGNLSIDALVSPSQDVAATITLQTLAVRGSEIDSLGLSAAGTLGKHSLRTEISGRGGRIAAEAAGGYADGRWAGALNTLSLDNELAGRWSMREPAEIIATANEFSLSEACIVRTRQTGRACALVAVGSDGSTSFDVTISDLPLTVLPLPLPQGAALGGFGDVKARGAMAEGRLTADGSVTLREARVNAIVDDEPISATFSTAAGIVSIVDNQAESSLRIELADGAGTTTLGLNVEDILDIESAIAGRGVVEIDEMSLFAVLLPDIANPRGVVSGSLDISGSLGQPEFVGALAVADGAFGVRKAGIEITDINARLSQSSVGRLRLEGSARSGDGQVSIQGDTWASAETGIRSELLIMGQNFELSRLPDWEVAASPSIAVVLDDRATTVTGNLFIPRTNVRIKEIPESAESPSPDAIVHRTDGATSSARRRIDVDVAIGLGDDVRFAGFGLSTGIEGAIRVRGGTHAPYTGSGRLSLREGMYKAYGQELEIERGQLIFNGPLDNPQLDVRAVRRTADVVAGIQLSGTPSQLRSSLFSEPPLGDAEALSYLLTGRALSSSTSPGEGDMLNAAAFALGVSSAGNIVSQVRTGLGLETLAVEGGAEDGRLIAGKRFGNRLLVEYGYGLIDKLGTLLLRYQLTDRIVLESRTGTVSNFDIVYSVKKK